MATRTPGLPLAPVPDCHGIFGASCLPTARRSGTRGSSGTYPRTRSAIEVAGVEQALLIYERTVLSALQEFETAMTTFTQEGGGVGALERAATASREALRLSTGLHEKGLIDYEQLLAVQRSLLSQEVEVSAARGQAATSLVMLHRALGGGWDPSELDRSGSANEASDGSSPTDGSR